MNGRKDREDFEERRYQESAQAIREAMREDGITAADLSRALEEMGRWRGCGAECHAPDLLAALRDLVARCDGEEGVRADGSNIQTMQAHAAIRRAEGAEAHPNG